MVARLAVALSTLQFVGTDLFGDVSAALDPQTLELEINENALVNGVQDTIEIMQGRTRPGGQLARGDKATDDLLPSHLCHCPLD